MNRGERRKRMVKKRLASQKNVLFHPGMDALAMRTGKTTAFSRGFIPQGGVEYFTYSG